MWNFNTILGSFCYQVTKVIKDKESLTFHLKVRRKTSECPKCSKRSKYIHSYSLTRKIKHGVILGKICILKLKLRRFYCYRCKQVFCESTDLIKKYKRSTLNYKKEVVFNLTDRSFSSGTKKFKVSYSTQKRWLKEIISNEIFNFNLEKQENVPFTLGIDEVSFAGHDMVTTVGNITKHRLKGILYSRRKDELKKCLRSLPFNIKSLISEVVIDMCTLYLKAVEETLPHSSIVVDHFHVIQDANKRIQEERLILQDIYKKKIPSYIFIKNKENLSIKEIILKDKLLIEYKELKLLYETKERLRSMYKLSSKKEASDYMRHIISILLSSDNGYHILWGRSLSYWSKYILNYFNNRSTNGFMEGMHNKIKLIKRMSFGFKNKEVFIHKVMLSVLITSILLPQLLK